jgi:hypothetical protein
MIVIVETTFIVEFVIQQDQSTACEEILRLTAAGDPVRLVVPAFSIAEAGMMLERRRGERRDFIKSPLARQTTDRRESKVLARYRQILRELNGELLLAENSEHQRYDDFCANRIRSAATISLTREILNAAFALRTAGTVEKLPDAIVLASVISYLSELPSDSRPRICFVTPDRAFLDPLQTYNCTCLRSFSDAVAWIQK